MLTRTTTTIIPFLRNNRTQPAMGNRKRTAVCEVARVPSSEKGEFTFSYHVFIVVDMRINKFEHVNAASILLIFYDPKPFSISIYDNVKT